MTSLCEICGPENDCTCGGCQCKWCRHSRGERLDPMERAQIEAHNRALKIAGERRQLQAMASKIRERWSREDRTNA